MSYPMKFLTVKLKEMMKYNWIKYTLWLALFLPFINLAQVPERPEPPRLVNDFAGILDASQVTVLEDSLVQYARQTSNQIVVVTLSSLNGYDPAEMAYRIGESWGVGQKEKNNGIVVLVKPKSGTEKGQVYVSVGYGLEGAVPDAVANGKIIDNEMIPRFRENDYFGGIMNGIQIIMNLSRGEYTAEQYQLAKGNDAQNGTGGSVFLLILFLIILFAIIGGKNKRSFNTGKRSLPFWLLMGMMGSKGHGGSWSDFSGGRGGFGGFGGGSSGGFGGFGGGSFGGGGAGGSW
jgi:uncharacterized protein